MSTIPGYVVEAAARALYRWVWDEDHDDCWNRVEDSEANTYRDQARVVLEAAAEVPQ
jgi:hypothetical protein